MRVAPATLLVLTLSSFAPAAARPGASSSHEVGDPTAAWVFFIDKGLRSASDEAAAIAGAQNSLTPHALWRRSKTRGAAVADLLDVPVNGDYVRRVLATGATLRRRSRWLNAISVDANPELLELIRALPCVASVQPVARGRTRPDPAEPVPVTTAARSEAPHPAGGLDYGDCASQIFPIDVNRLHGIGLSGNGVIVALMDTGFEHETHVAVQGIDVLAEHDFIYDDDVTQNEAEDPPGQHYHGSWVLSLIAGFAPGHLIGPAYGARYLLAKTEDIASETPVEEDYWVEAAEWADSLGADVISTSLGYIDWYTYEDMDGDTAPITIAADLAAANGIAVFASAGNSGWDPWYHIGAPADGDSVITVGAVDSLGFIAGFSSHGPTYDGRTKPDVCAMGVNTLVALVGTTQDYGRGSGTSFSCPITAGVGALLLESHPLWTPVQLRGALRTTANRAGSPDQSYGWGLIQGWAANGVRTRVPAPPVPGISARLAVSPNPSTGAVTIHCTTAMAGASSIAPLIASPSPSSSTESLSLTIVDVGGRLVRDIWRGAAGGPDLSLAWDGRDTRGERVPQGIYYARLRGGGADAVRPIVIIR